MEVPHRFIIMFYLLSPIMNRIYAPILNFLQRRCGVTGCYRLFDAYEALEYIEWLDEVVGIAMEAENDVL